MTYRVIQVGTGGQGRRWCRDFLPPLVQEERCEVVAAVDVDEDAHEHARRGLGLDRAACYTDAAEAFSAHPEADVATVVVPPYHHEEIVDGALEHGLDILSEKPIADTLAAAARIAAKVADAGVKMGVTMSHRFDRDKLSFEHELRKPAVGPLDYLVGRFTCDARSYGDWGAFRHDIPDPLLVEGAVHQLDMLAALAGSRCQRLYADTWKPAWAEYEGDCQALLQLRFENGVRATWEGAKANAVGLNGWGSDYLRAECRDATVVLDDRSIVRHDYDASSTLIGGATDERSGDPVELLEGDRWQNELLLEQFFDWLDGDDPMATNVEDNLQSMALVEAAIQSSNTGDAVAVQDLLADARASVSI